MFCQIKIVSDVLHDYWKTHCYGDGELLGDDDEEFHELDRRRQLSGITSFLWLPGVLRTRQDSTVVMVITTETNHVVFIRCVFDIPQGLVCAWLGSRDVVLQEHHLYCRSCDSATG